MRVRLTDGPDDSVYLESSYADWSAVKEDFKDCIPSEGRRWEPDLKKWLVRALYVADLLSFLAQHRAEVKDDRQPVQAREGQPPMPEDLRDAFVTLHLLPSAPLAVAEGAFRALAKYYHPDKGGALEDFHAVNNAIKTIKGYLDPQEAPDDSIPF